MSKFQITASIVVYEQTIESVRRTIESFLSTGLNVKLFLVANSTEPDLGAFLSDPRVEIIGLLIIRDLEKGIIWQSEKRQTPNIIWY